jgi:hypothetical protein
MTPPHRRAVYVLVKCSPVGLDRRRVDARGTAAEYTSVSPGQRKKIPQQGGNATAWDGSHPSTRRLRRPAQRAVPLHAGDPRLAPRRPARGDRGLSEDQRVEGSVPKTVPTQQAKPSDPAPLGEGPEIARNTQGNDSVRPSMLRCVDPPLQLLTGGLQVQVLPEEPTYQ